MPAVMVPASFQDIEKPFEIGVGVGMRMIDRISHPGLGRHMDHRRKPMLRKQLADRRTVRQIHLHETELRVLAQYVQPRPLQGRVIVIVETVQAENMTALGQELAGDVKTDKSRRTRDQNCLIRHRIPSGHRSGSAAPAAASITRRIEGVAIPSCAAIARSALKPYQGGEVRRPASGCAVFDHPSQT